MQPGLPALGLVQPLQLFLAHGPVRLGMCPFTADGGQRGVTIALLDTGVDRAQPFLRGRIVNGVDIVGGQTYATAAPKPDDQSQLERHGTEMAGLLVGAGGPAGLAGVATGASVLPIRVAGWQRGWLDLWSAQTTFDVVGVQRDVAEVV